MALAACDADPGFARFDPKQARVIRALLDASKPHVIVTGGAGSGKTTTVNFAVKKLAEHDGVSCIRVAVSDLTAERFGGGDAVNLMLFCSILDSFCNGRTHYAAEENASVAAFLKGLVCGRVLVAIDEFGLMSAANLTRTVTLLWRASQKSHIQFSKVQLVLIGDPGGQMPPINGESVVFSSVFNNHSSNYVRRLVFAKLEGQHRFSLSAREHMQHVLGCDQTGREQYLQSQKAKFNKDAYTHLYVTLLKSRKGCERVIRRMADQLYADVPVEEVRIGTPPSEVGTLSENQSKNTPGTFILPKNRDAGIFEVTAWSQRIWAQSREDPERKVKVNNRQRFYITEGSFHDLPPVDEDSNVIEPPKSLGKEAPSVTVFIDGEEFGIPIFVKNGKDEGTILGIRQVGFATPNETGTGYNDLGMALLLFNTQGDQFPGKKIVIGSDQDPSNGTRLRLADFCVGVSRTSDPSMCLFHPKAHVFVHAEEVKKYAEIKAALDRLEKSVSCTDLVDLQRQQTRSPVRKRPSKFASFSSSPPSSSPAKRPRECSGAQPSISW